MKGSKLNHDGTLGPLEQVGPGDIDLWLTSWKVYSTTMLMLDIVDLGVLNAYETLIVSLHTDYGGPLIWPFLYQTEVRARGEHINTIVMRLVSASIEARGYAQFQASRPWNEAFRALVNDTHWWNKFERKANAILTKLRSQESVIDGDVQIGNCIVDTHPSDRVPPPPTPAEGQRRPPKKGTQARQVHATPFVNMPAGLYTHNKKRNAICIPYQTGNCRNADGS